jgi:hypothetical protein
MYPVSRSVSSEIEKLKDILELRFKIPDMMCNRQLLYAIYFDQHDERFSLLDMAGH